MNPAASLTHVNPWVVITLAAALLLLLVTALMVIFEPGLAPAIRIALQGPASRVAVCPSTTLICP